MEITSAKFIKGITGTNEIIEDSYPQIAFIGRSNVGKSSVINSLIKSKTLVKSGSTPGKTKQINFFLINKKIYFVDLPGYGFMKASLKQREKAKKMILWYLFRSQINFKKVVLIIDSKIGITKFDQEMLDLLNQNECSIALVVNKIDRLKKNQLDKQLKNIKESTNQEIIPYSAKTNQGREELLNKISEN